MMELYVSAFILCVLGEGRAFGPRDASESYRRRVWPGWERRRRLPDQACRPQEEKERL